MRAIWSLLLVLAATVVFTGQEPPHAIRVDVQMVSLDVGVFDAGGRPVLDLRKEDFLIFEDGQPQEIRYFAPAEQPHNIVLLFDCSDSTSGHWPLINKAVDEFSKHKKPGDRVLLAAFASSVYTLLDWDAPETAVADFDINAPARGRGNRRACNGTALYGALQWAAQKLRPVQTRKGIVILTDGVDSSPDKIVEEESRKALVTFRSAGIPIYFIGVGTDINPTLGVSANPPEVRVAMERLAEVSGGRSVFPKRVEDLIPTYDRIGRELRTSYSIGYAPPASTPDGKRHRITVRLRSGNLRIQQSREDYLSR
jgi:Ca-activated chloride channel family protein